jgi:Flp pilus assembly protein TadG
MTMVTPRPWAATAAFLRDCRGATAVEFSFLALPFLLLIMCVMQLGMYYMTQVSLDAGTVKEAETLRQAFNTGVTPVLPTGSALKTAIVSASGNGVVASGMAVEIQPLANLDSGGVAISDGTANYGTAWTPLVLRAKYTFSTFLPGWASTVSINSSAIVRRQGE